MPIYGTVIAIANGGVPVIEKLGLFRDYHTIKASHYDGKIKKPEVTIDLFTFDIKYPVLLVDDVVDTGDTIEAITKEIVERVDGGKVDVACLVVKPWTKIWPEYWIECRPEWIEFPWSIKN